MHGLSMSQKFLEVSLAKECHEWSFTFFKTTLHFSRVSKGIPRAVVALHMRLQLIFTRHKDSKMVPHRALGLFWWFHDGSKKNLKKCGPSAPSISKVATGKPAEVVYPRAIAQGK